MTPADIAADIRRVSPGALPKSFGTTLPSPLNGRIWIVDPNLTSIPECPDDIAEAVLIAAMVMDLPYLVRDERHGSKCWGVDSPSDGVRTWFADSDHGGPLGACHAAWRWAKGLDTKETT